MLRFKDDNFSRQYRMNRYYFSDFEYDLNQKILRYKGEVVELTRKNHELLSYLLQNPKKLIPREELIEHVWNGRVVTNNTIDQCILKLRKTLNEFHEGEYIEAVYGQGIRFLPKINHPAESAPPVTGKRIVNKFWLGVLLIAAVLSVGTWLLIKQTNNATINIENNIVPPQDIPASPSSLSAKDDWLLDGSSTYLGYLFHLYPNISLQKIQRVKTNQTQKPQLILDLVSNNQSILTVQVDLYQQPSQENKINSYFADLSLTVNNVKLEEIQFKANNLTELFPDIARWVAQYDGSETAQQIADPHVFTENESALLSFFKGLTLQIRGDSKAALSHFNQATDSDADFKLAWYEKAISQRKQGDYKKAISVLNAITTNDPWLAFRVSVAKGITYNLLDNTEAANQSFETALQSAKRSHNYDGMAAIYVNQAILYSDNDQYNQAEQRLVLALDLPTMSNQHRRYGSIMNAYAKVAANMNNLPLAIEKSQMAIKAYQLSGNGRYEMHAKSRLAGLLIQSNEFKQAEQLVKEAMSYAKSINNPKAQISNHHYLATIFQKTGRFESALTQWQRAITLTTEYEIYDATAHAYLNKLKINLLQQNPAQAKVNLNLLSQLIEEQADDEINQAVLEAKLLLALYNKDVVLSQQHLKSLTSSDFELIEVYQGDVARLLQQPAKAELHYLEALMVANNTGRYDQIVRVMNKLNELYLKFNTHKLADNLQQTGKLKPFIYPYQKYQAIAAHAAGNHINALSLMQELKLKAGGFWQESDQQLLEEYKTSVSQ